MNLFLTDIANAESSMTVSKNERVSFFLGDIIVYIFFKSSRLPFRGIFVHSCYLLESVVRLFLHRLVIWLVIAGY